MVLIYCVTAYAFFVFIGHITLVFFLRCINGIDWENVSGVAYFVSGGT